MEEAGLYSAAYRVFLTLCAVGLLAAQAMQPMLARGIKAGRGTQMARALRGALLDLAAFALAVLAAAELAGGRALGFLFGSQYEAMGPTFILLCVGLTWYSVGLPAGYSSIAGDRNERYLAGAATAGAVSLGLNLVLIPPLGTIGAATATAVAFASATLIWLLATRLLDRAMLALVVLLAVSSGGGVASAAAPAAGPAVGAITAAGAISLALGRRRLGARER